MNKIQAEHFMRIAIQEGRKAIEKCKPNPPVGCVLVKAGKIIATGHTNEPGQPHAEAMALNQLQGDLDKVIAFVTLEPCSFHGRTPSCAQELVKRKIQQVYIGMIDPHPKNRGSGIQILTEAGITVQQGILIDEVKHDLKPYLINHDCL
ncbi:MAG: bifunctional diaminohydroxyphosphoribosylaminopyrimidine deaminase/5-amino-6-(5-phosphoribosylamino)uracil reductase RibD [Gammaproteobacteria bacterium]|nr:bifunctional diaminohydroxyphosphoribosylaminopyrimidine deaminase/5-amino-6-(5-phosphoribosylamino)uracil reductase RibD [Gammaproteobacteria bacterium]